MKLEQMAIKELLDTSHTIAEKLFDGQICPWEVLLNIGVFIEGLDPILPGNEYRKVGKNIWIHKTAKITPTIVVGGPMIVCAKTETRQSVFLRRRVIIGEGAVIGNSRELKNSIISDGAQAPYFNYVGDTIMGFRAHMGAGVVTSNVRSNRSLAKVHAGGEDATIGFKKFGAILGDHVEIGCNSILNPGTVIGRNSNVYPLSSVRGCVPADSIYKNQDNIVTKEVREQEAEPEATEPGKGGPKVVK